MPKGGDYGDIKSLAFSQENLASIYACIDDQYHKKTLIGFSLLHVASDIGMHFFLPPSNSTYKDIEVQLGNSILLDDYNISDFSKALKIILPVLYKLELDISVLECCDRF